MTRIGALLTGVLMSIAPVAAQVIDFTDEPRAEVDVPAGNDSPDAQAPAGSLLDPRDRIFYAGDTERIKPLTRKLLGNILLDQKEIWESPFKMNRKNSMWWIGFGAATAALIATDHRTSTALENSQGQVRWGNNISHIGASYTLIPIVAGFYAYGVIADDPKPREIGVLGAESLLDSLIVVQILKPIAGRNRPNAPHDKAEFFDGGSSFPSGHAIESWALASLIAHEYSHQKFVPVLVYGLAGVVSVARFTAQQHFASDIVAGGAMGWFIGRYVYQTHMDHSIHKHAWAQPRITPIFQPAGGTYGVALAFGN
jgi:membrane-associated phospholipid phosphatase